MKLRVLVDNNTFIDDYYYGEPGLSYYIEDGDTKILFDTGYSDVFMTNAKSMGIDLSKIDKLVLSHGHNDHTRGMKFYLDGKKDLELITHPRTLAKKLDRDGEDFGAPFTKEELEKMVKLTLTDKPLKISENMYFLGEIPIVFDYEKRYSIGKTLIKNYFEEDFITEDSAIVYKGKDGIFVITACSHSGISNIIQEAKRVTGVNNVIGVIGGFHLFEKNDRLEKTIEYLKNENIDFLYPCHCVSLKAKIEMGKMLDIREVGVGLELNVE